MLQISDHAADLFETPFYLRGVCETCSNAPPNPCQSRWHCELILQPRNDRRIVVGIKEGQHQIEPLAIGRQRQDIQKENK
jgi:hypothetical protein